MPSEIIKKIKEAEFASDAMDAILTYLGSEDLMKVKVEKPAAAFV